MARRPLAAAPGAPRVRQLRRAALALVVALATYPAAAQPAPAPPPAPVIYEDADVRVTVEQILVNTLVWRGSLLLGVLNKSGSNAGLVAAGAQLWDSGDRALAMVGNPGGSNSTCGTALPLLKDRTLLVTFIFDGGSIAPVQTDGMTVESRLSLCTADGASRDFTARGTGLAGISD